MDQAPLHTQVTEKFKFKVLFNWKKVIFLRVKSMNKHSPTLLQVCVPLVLVLEVFKPIYYNLGDFRIYRGQSIEAKNLRNCNKSA